ncbi:MAG: RNA 3'-terminal phosphate cyclase [Methanomassiliicoccales archaeon]|nr:RNA 3'-terminal phosphate cyclase [Methanomassiliicoccales archaeon]
MIELDGSHGEGGGQLLRTALSLSVLTGQDLLITKIRAGRPDPGLKPQHLAGVRLITNLCNAEVVGDEVGSQRLEFRPGALVGGTYKFDVGTAGSLTLLIQTVLPALVLSPVRTELELVGGTDVRWSPPVDHYRMVLLPLIRRMGAQVEMEVEARGFYPRGGGKVRLKVSGGELRKLSLDERGELRRITGVSFVQNLPGHVAQRMADAVRRNLLGMDVQMRFETGTGDSTGAGVVLTAEYENTIIGWSSRGEKGMSAEVVGREAASGLTKEMEGGGTLDAHTADQLLPFLALAGQDSEFTVREVSGHLGTQIWLVPHYLPVRFEMTEGAPFRVRISRT